MPDEWFEWVIIKSNQIKSIFIVHQYTKRKKRVVWAQETTFKTNK